LKAKNKNKSWLVRLVSFLKKDAKEPEKEIKLPVHILYAEKDNEQKKENVGTPLLPLNEVLEPHKEIITHTKRISGHASICGEYTFETIFLPVIENYAKYIHLLPASSGWHHSKTGGLITHSLQVANRSLRIAKSTHLTANQKLDVERSRHPRWQYAAWIAGLLHDAGKIYTDIKVTDAKNSNVVWHPLMCDIIEWGNNNNVGRYFVTWRKDRIHKKHETSSLAILHTILPDAAKKYISECPDDLHSALSDCLSGYAHFDGYLQNAVRRSDSLSTSQDIKQVWDLELGPREAELFEKVINAMKELSDKWLSDKKIRILGDEVFLEWPYCITEIQELLVDAEQGNIPVTSLLDHLVERGIVRGLDREKYAQYYAGVSTRKESFDIINKIKPVTFQNLLRIEWSYHVLGDSPMPKNEIGLLTLNENGKAVIFSNDGSTLITEEEVQKEKINLANLDAPEKDTDQTKTNATTENTTNENTKVDNAISTSNEPEINTIPDDVISEKPKKPKPKSTGIKIKPKNTLSTKEKVTIDSILLMPKKKKKEVKYDSNGLIQKIIIQKTSSAITKYNNEYYILEADALDAWGNSNGWTELNKANCLNEKYSDSLRIVQAYQLGNKKVRAVKLNLSTGEHHYKATNKKEDIPFTDNNIVIPNNKTLHSFITSNINLLLEKENNDISLSEIEDYLSQLLDNEISIKENILHIDYDALMNITKSDKNERLLKFIIKISEYDPQKNKVRIK